MKKEIYTLVILISFVFGYYHSTIAENFSVIKKSTLNRGYLTTDELQSVLLNLGNYHRRFPDWEGGTAPPAPPKGTSHPHIEAFSVAIDAIDKDMLPFKAMFFLTLEKDNYDEAELIRRNWIGSLNYLREVFAFYGRLRGKGREFFERQGLAIEEGSSIFPKLQLQAEKIQIVGLTDPMLISLRKELAIAVRDKKWDDAQKIQNIITARVKELAPPPALPQPQIRASRGQTTVVVEQPFHIQIEQLPRYGVRDYARVLSVMGGKTLNPKDEATLKLFDMLMGR